MDIKSGKTVLMLMVLAVFAVSSLAHFLNKPSGKPGLENLVLIYSSRSLIRIEYEPGCEAFFTKEPEIHLTITPVSKKVEMVKLNFTLEVRGDAFLGCWNESVSIPKLDELLKDMDKPKLRPNITENFYCSKSILVDFDLKTRVAYLDGKNIGILPFGITEASGSIAVASVWLQKSKSIEVNKVFPPDAVMRAIPFGTVTIDLVNGIGNLTIFQIPAGLNINKTQITKLNLSQMPQSYRKLAEILGKEKLEFIMLSNASSSYLDYFAWIRIEKITGIPVDFRLPGGPVPVIEGGTYLYNDKPIEYFPVMPLAYFLGIRENHDSFSLTDVRIRE